MSITFISDEHMKMYLVVHIPKNGQSPSYYIALWSVVIASPRFWPIALNNYSSICLLIWLLEKSHYCYLCYGWLHFEILWALGLVILTVFTVCVKAICYNLRLLHFVLGWPVELVDPEKEGLMLLVRFFHYVQEGYRPLQVIPYK